MKRKITFVTGEVVNYDLTSSELEVLLDKLSNFSSYNKTADNVYKIGDLEVLETLYNSSSSHPSDDNVASSVHFFVGDIILSLTIKAVDDDVLFKCLEKFSTLFSCSKITDDVYKVVKL